ncbi:unnamed protein product [Cylicocyclus nassatus]|uniref:Uncharacterized protein n=1 Tax=Cylicocyclus nassatus TaxID=53992 RepID=A0AA36HC07_CYLNA|nr:unnamed protein product [Cylicocyclus nassatus]
MFFHFILFARQSRQMIIHHEDMCLLMLAVLANLWVVSSKWMIGDYYMEKCDPNAGIDSGSDLFVAKAHVITVNKESRQKTHNFYTTECIHGIFEKDKYPVNWNLSAYEEYYDRLLNNSELVLAILVGRNGTNRKNDNRVVFHHADYKECVGDKNETGTESDFSSMYFKSPFRPGRIVIDIYEDTSRKRHLSTLLDYKPPQDCYATGSWIANEGLYLLDVTTQEWYPIYYDIWSEPVFIF